MTMADEREQVEARRRRHDERRRRLDDVASLESLDVYDWTPDPWDDVAEVGAVERLRVQTRMAKWVTYTVLAIVLALILGAGGVGWWYVRRINPPGDPGPLETFTVSPNDTLRSVSERLEEQGFITDAGVFRWYVGNHGGLTLTPGYYDLRAGDHMGNVMGRLGTPPNETFIQVTFPEGYTIHQMAERLHRENPRFSVEAFTNAANDPAAVAYLRPEGVTSMEGLLFPDTYQFSNAETESVAVSRMAQTMERVARQEDLESGAQQLMRTPYEILIIASMIEEEAKVDEDRPKIARVIYNRLAIDMPLQIDATLLYNQPTDPRPSIADLREVDTPYNTYLHTGLPPTPISNPGRASIEAALHPANDPTQGDEICRDLPDPSDCHYLYYVLAFPNGAHKFAATLEQHEANTAAAREAGVLP